MTHATLLSLAEKQKPNALLIQKPKEYLQQRLCTVCHSRSMIPNILLTTNIAITIIYTAPTHDSYIHTDIYGNTAQACICVNAGGTSLPTYDLTIGCAWGTYGLCLIAVSSSYAKPRQTGGMCICAPMHVCVCVCASVFMHMHAYASVFMCMHLCSCVCICVHVYACIWICVHVYGSVFTRMHLCSRACMHMDLCSRVFMRMHAYGSVFMCMHLCSRACMHMDLCSCVCICVSECL